MNMMVESEAPALRAAHAPPYRFEWAEKRRQERASKPAAAAVVLRVLQTSVGRREYRSVVEGDRG
jgi:hypothetical protein